MKITIYHEIHAEDLKIMSFLFRVYHQRACFYGISCNFFHLWIHLLIEIVLPTIFFIQVFLKLFITNFITLLVFSILRQVFLNCIIGQMNGGKSVFCGILKRCGSDIAELVPIPFDDSINRSNHHVMT